MARVALVTCLLAHGALCSDTSEVWHVKQNLVVHQNWSSIAVHGLVLRPFLFVLG
jgi:hypothetical protein